MAVTRFPKGISTVREPDPLAQSLRPDPTETVEFWDDFINYDASHWVITATVGTGSATEVLQDEVGGVLTLTNDANDDNSDFLQWSSEEDSNGLEVFKLSGSEKAWFKARFKVSDATQSDFVIGLQIVDTTPLDVTDGVFFQKDDGDTDLDFHVEKDNTATSETAIHTMEDATYVVVGWYYDKTNFHVYVDGEKVATVADTNLPNDEELTISFGVQNGEAAAKTMSVDYIYASQERP